MNLDFSEDEIRRYSRHILLAEVGGIGQAKLKAAKVLVIGAGGLGSPLLLYLAAAGVGTIGVVDDDVVEISNLQRQIAHSTADIGRPKVESAAERARAINPEVDVRLHRLRLSAENALTLVGEYDIVCDGTDNFATRFLVSDACVLARRTLVSAAVLRFEGQVYVFKPHAAASDGTRYPCYRCLYPEAPPEGMVPTCSEAGVLGAVTGVMGSLQATEVLKEILGIGETLAGRMLIWDALATRFRTVKLRRDLLCRACGETPSLHDLSGHEMAAACAV
jgi:adenylyltransferase/sulfurtransferase